MEEQRTEQEEKQGATEAVRPVSPKEPGYKARILGKICDLIEYFVVSACAGSTKLNFFLDGNFAPTEECGPVKDLPVIGSLPSCLNGEFVRTGPNPKLKPVAGYHWFDGDGMLHGVRIKDGSASYVCRYVKTSKLKQEGYYGSPKFLKVGDMKGLLGIFMANLYNLRSWLGVVDTEYGVGTANTAMVFHNKKLLALLESDKPYAIRMLEDGDLETIGVLDYGKRLSHGVTAHPKVDPVTGEMFFFVYQFEAPFCIYRSISKEGSLQDPVSINIPEPVMMHDFAITENYAVFMDLPLTIRPRNLLEGKMIFSFDSSKMSRFGVLPRYSKTDSQMQWFELPACYIFHIANAWEEGDEVVLVACRMPTFDIDLKGGTSGNIIELYEFRFNLKNGCASEKRLSKGTPVEFPRIHDGYVGRKQKYVFASLFHDQLRIKGVAKFNLEKEPDGEEPSNVEGMYFYGEGRYGSEAVFVPRSWDKDANEDDGYLISFVYDEPLGKSEMVVMDAKTMSSEPVAVVSIPTRVPYGFHAIFVNEEQLQSQS